MSKLHTLIPNAFILLLMRLPKVNIEVKALALKPFSLEITRGHLWLVAWAARKQETSWGHSQWTAPDCGNWWSSCQQAQARTNVSVELYDSYLIVENEKNDLLSKRMSKLHTLMPDVFYISLNFPVAVSYQLNGYSEANHYMMELDLLCRSLIEPEGHWNRR